MSGNFEGIKIRGIGIEIECTGITRKQAANAVARALDSHAKGKYKDYKINMN